MKTKQLIGSLAATAVVASGSLALAGPVAGAAETQSCSTESWPAAANGRPAVHLDAQGVYLWHTARGWRLRVNEPGADRAVFTGSVRVDGRVVAIGRHLENHGEGVVTRTGAGAVGFRFVNYGGVDGLNLATRCSSKLVLRVSMNGHVVPPSRVFVGADGHHPSSLPTTVTRGA